MKKNWSKNTLIVLIAFASMAVGAYIMVAKPQTHRVAKAKGPASLKRGTVIPASAFKDDSELQACYEALLARDPEVQEGSVQLHMTINETGEINDLKMIHSDLEDEEFTGCVTETVRRKRIQPTADRLGVVISHKFNFHKKQNNDVTFVQ